MELYYIILGVLITLSVVYLWQYSRVNLLSKGAWALAISTIVIGAFAISWVIASLAERETQAAGMGALIFGGISVLCFLGFMKLSKTPAVKSDGQSIQG